MQNNFLCSFVSTLEDVSSLSKFHFVFVLFFSLSFNRPNLFFPIQSRAQLSTVKLSFFFHFCFAGEIAKLRNCGQSKVCPEGRAQDRGEVDRNNHRVDADVLFVLEPPKLSTVRSRWIFQSLCSSSFYSELPLPTTMPLLRPPTLMHELNYWSPNR